MARDISLKELTYQSSGRFLQWVDQETGSSVVNGAPTVDVSGVDVSGLQICKLGIIPAGGAVLDFRIWVQYDGLARFVFVDGSSREGISSAWTQELNVAGVNRIYVEITSISAGTFDVKMGKGAITVDEDTFVAGEALSVGDAVYLDLSDDKVYKASTSLLRGYADRFFLGLALTSAVLDANVEVRYRGLVQKSISGATTEDLVYLTDSTPGDLTTTFVAGSENISVGYVTSSTEIILDDEEIEIEPVRQFGTEFISNWSDLQDGIYEGQRLIYRDVNGNDADFSWDTVNSKWVLQSTKGEWILLEDWSSGEIRPELWQTLSNSGHATVTSNRLQILVESGTAQDIHLKAVPNLSVECEVRHEVHFGGVPSQSSSGGVTTSSKLEDVGGSGFLIDGRAGMATFSSSVLHSVYDSTGNIGYTGSRDSSALWHIYTKLSRYHDNKIRPWSGISTEAFVEESEQFTVQAGSVSQMDYEIKITNNGVFSGGPYTVYIGKIWIKR